MKTAPDRIYLYRYAEPDRLCKIANSPAVCGNEGGRIASMRRFLDERGRNRLRGGGQKFHPLVNSNVTPFVFWARERAAKMLATRCGERRVANNSLPLAPLSLPPSERSIRSDVEGSLARQRKARYNRETDIRMRRTRIPSFSHSFSDFVTAPPGICSRHALRT